MCEPILRTITTGSGTNDPGANDPGANDSGATDSGTNDSGTAQTRRVTLELDLPDGLPCFRGHFPGFPVLAGVIQLDWVMRLGAAHLACGQQSATDFRIKFIRVIVPGNPLTLTLDHDHARHRLDFVYRVDGLVASRGRITLAAQ
jgi:3-hydroxymyristoyl/3-hydroxydecanoyl-(acyl carrier protein) dehydratase